MKWLLITILFVIAAPLSGAQAQSAHFQSYYDEMCRMATGDERAAYEFSKLMELEPKSAEFVALFWMEAARNSSPVALDRIVDSWRRSANEQAEALRKNDKVLADRLKDRSLELFFVVYFYEHAAAIKDMVRLHLSKAIKGKEVSRIEQLRAWKDQRDKWDREILTGEFLPEK